MRVKWPKPECVFMDPTLVLLQAASDLFAVETGLLALREMLPITKDEKKEKWTMAFTDTEILDFLDQHGGDIKWRWFPCDGPNGTRGWHSAINTPHYKQPSMSIREAAVQEMIRRRNKANKEAVNG